MSILFMMLVNQPFIASIRVLVKHLAIYSNCMAVTCLSKDFLEVLGENGPDHISSKTFVDSQNG
jgi:hypothetical protein